MPSAFRKPQRLAMTTTAAQVAHARPAEPIPVPALVRLVDDDEHAHWQALTALREPADWRPADLILVGRIASLGGQIRRAQARLDAEGLIVQSARGSPAAHPLLAAIDLLQRQQLAIYRTLGLGHGTTVPAVLNRTGQAAARTRLGMAESADDDGLLA